MVCIRTAIVSRDYTIGGFCDIDLPDRVHYLEMVGSSDPNIPFVIIVIKAGHILDGDVG